MVLSTPSALERPANYHIEWTPQVGASQVPNYKSGPWAHPEPQREDLLLEGISHSLQVAAAEFKN